MDVEKFYSADLNGDGTIGQAFAKLGFINEIDQNLSSKDEGNSEARWIETLDALLFISDIFPNSDDEDSVILSNAAENKSADINTLPKGSGASYDDSIFAATDTLAGLAIEHLLDIDNLIF